MGKRETIVECLRRYREAQETLSCTEVGSGGNAPLMPSTWNDTFRQLERLLKRMSRERPAQYHHVRGRYLHSNRVQRELVFRAGRYVGLDPFEAVVTGFAGSFDPLWDAGPRKHKDAKGTPVGWCIVETWRPDVRRERVRRGVEWLTEEFVGEPFLPLEMVKAQEAA